MINIHSRTFFIFKSFFFPRKYKLDSFLTKHKLDSVFTKTQTYINNLIMDKQPCYCNKCKGAVVSKRTFHRHLVKEQHKPYTKYKRISQNVQKKLKVMKILMFI